MASLRRPFLTPVVIIVTLLLGAALTFATMSVEQRIVAARFDRLADLVAGRLQQRMIQHLALLQATRGYLEAENGNVTVPEFAAYIGDLGLQDDYRGIQGIGFAPLLPVARSAQAAERIGRDNGTTVQILPPTDQPRIGPIAVLEPQNERNRHALGYDMFSEPVRRAAMTAALESGEPRVSAPVSLVQEITEAKQAGFLIFLPTRVGLFDLGQARDRGFVYAPFRAGDLHQAILDELPGIPLTLRTIDLEAPQIPLFDTLPADARRRALREIDVAGRKWQLTLAPTRSFGELRDHSAGITVALLSLLLLGAVWGMLRGVHQKLVSAEETAAQSLRQAEARNLLLREMQHRIKNHIARIQAIARQTLRESQDLPGFERIFSARLSAMAKAQDALGREGWGTADLKTLLKAELEQVLNTALADSVIDGPEIRLDARASQAMGLAAHELATNAMKYGRDIDQVPQVSWRRVKRGDKTWLHLTWREPGARPAVAPSAGSGGDPEKRGGFGSQLIEALIEGDLEGRFARQFDAEGMRVTIEFPIADP